MAAEGPWRVRPARRQPFGTLAGEVFEDDLDAETVLAVVGGPGDPESWPTLVAAGQEAIHVGRLVVVSSAPGLSGYCASLHAEHPSLGVTLLRTSPSVDGLRAARRFAAAEPGRLREVVLDSAHVPRQPLMAVAEPEGGTFPFGPPDVVLLSGLTPADNLTDGSGLACATALASRGAALAVIGPPGGGEAPGVAARLNELRAAGTRVCFEAADLGDEKQTTAAVRRVEQAFGPVTGLVHAAGPAPERLCAALDDESLRDYLAREIQTLTGVVGGLTLARLRLLLTFGSVSARYGARGACADALAASALAERAARLADGHPGCRVLHIDWPLRADRGSPPDPGTVRGRAGPEPRPGPGDDRASALVPGGSGLLMTTLATPDLPARLAVHGRVGAPAPPVFAARTPEQTTRGGFLRTVRVHYPRVEIVADARLSSRTDPYLADYQVDGVPVLPAALGLEAMAQAVMALTGEPWRRARGVRMEAPIPVLPTWGGTTIRVCALRRGDTVESVIRCESTGFLVDHFRAVFTRPGPAPEEPAEGPEPERAADSPGPGGIVDGTDLYGPVCFQSGRFRRVAFLPEVSSRSCRALARGGDDQPWFGPGEPGGRSVPGEPRRHRERATSVPGDPERSELLLGSPGLNDATVHVLQACLPHRRVLPAGCESVSFSGREVRGAVHVRAARRSAPPGPQSPPAAGDDVWDVAASDATGHILVRWTGLRLNEVGPLAQTSAWHPALLAASLEGRAIDLGLDPSLRVTVSAGQTRAAAMEDAGSDAPPAGARADGGRHSQASSTGAVSPSGRRADGRLSGAPPADAASGEDGPGGEAAGKAVPAVGGPAEHGAGSAGANVSRHVSPAPAPGSPPSSRMLWLDRAPGRGALDGLELSVQAGRPVACRWEAAGSPPRAPLQPGRDLDVLRARLQALPGESAATAHARVRAVSSCLSAVGLPGGAPAVLTAAREGGWALVRAGDAAVACAVVTVAGVPSPVAVAILTIGGDSDEGTRPDDT